MFDKESKMRNGNLFDSSNDEEDDMPRKGIGKKSYKARNVCPLCSSVHCGENSICDECGEVDESSTSIFEAMKLD